MTPWRAMVLAPLLAAAVVVLFLEAPAALSFVHGIPVIGRLLQRIINPNAANILTLFGVFCPAIPAILGVAFFWHGLKAYRNLKAQGIRTRRLREREMREMPGVSTLEHLAQNKVSIDNRRKSI
jgi:hypothetical protein